MISGPLMNRSRSASAGALLVVALAAAACGSSATSSSGKPDVPALRARSAGDPAPARSPGAPPALVRSEDT